MKRLLWIALALAGAFALLGWLRPQWMLSAWLRTQAWAAGASVHTLEVEGWRWRYLEAGAGARTLVLLHGFTGMKENWLPLLPYLSQRYRILVPDLLHTNPAQRRADMDLGYAAQAARLNAFIGGLADGPVVIVGHSMGGGIAAVYAAEHTDRVDALVLVAAGGVRFADNEFALAVLRGENPFAVSDRDSLDRYLRTVFIDPPATPWPFDRALIKSRLRDAGFEQRMLDAIGRGPDAFVPGERADDIEAPTLLLWCREDRVVDRSAAALYAERIPGSEIRTLDGCNHMPMAEQPEATAAAIEAFLTEHPPH
ncbi:MAG TPA: alpha/beta fold hydrolase [Xanthomonadaceae bacterium]|nr:alpha/beta fold hydrolase [Xanthomonadaceae bacterium]